MNKSSKGTCMNSPPKQKKGRMMVDIACLLMLGITVVFLVMAVLTSFGSDINWKSPLTTVLLAAGGFFTFISVFMRKPTKNIIKDLGFYAMHLGLVVMLVGFALFELAGDTVSANVPIGSDTFYSNIGRENGEICELGFNFRVTDFSIDYHEDGSEKQYRAGIEFADAVTLRVEEDELSVNHTLKKNGWRIYLMSYSGEYVNLMFRSDPGDYVVKTGVWMTIAGTILSLLVANMIPAKKKEGDE